MIRGMETDPILRALETEGAMVDSGPSADRRWDAELDPDAWGGNLRAGRARTAPPPPSEADQAAAGEDAGEVLAVLVLGRALKLALAGARAKAGGNPWGAAGFARAAFGAATDPAAQPGIDAAAGEVLAFTRAVLAPPPADPSEELRESRRLAEAIDDSGAEEVVARVAALARPITGEDVLRADAERGAGP